MSRPEPIASQKRNEEHDLHGMVYRGMAVPGFVRGEEQMRRWRLCVDAVSAALAQPSNSAAVWSAARMLYFDASIPTD